MAGLSSNLFSIGVILVTLGFAAYVGHAVMLANGRRLAVSLRTSQQPAYAGVVTGSFVDEQARASGTGLATAAAPSPLSRVALGLGLVAWLSLGASLILRGIVVGRGPWGNMFEFTVAFAFSIVGGYLFLQRRLRRSARSGSSRSAWRWPCCSTRRACRRTSSRSSRHSRTPRC